MESLIYTLLRAADWRMAESLGAYHGSADDLRDGYLHFSTAAQLRASAAKHRAGCDLEAALAETAVGKKQIPKLPRTKTSMDRSRPR